MTTKEIEKILYNYLWKKGWYGVYECAIPKILNRKTRRERVDMLTYETTGIYRAYEIKVSKQDLHSKAALSWIGHYNYLVITEDLIKDAKEMLPEDIGIYVVYNEIIKERVTLVRNPKKRELLCGSEHMQFAMLQALSREYKKYRKLKEQEYKNNSSSKRSKRKNG